MAWAKAAALVALCATAALAETDLATFRPQPRPAELTTMAAPAADPDDLSQFRPMPKPDFSQPVAVEPHIRPLPRPDFTVLAVAAIPTIRPMPRPDLAPEVQLAALPQPAAKPAKPGKASLKGSVCNRPEIKGRALEPIKSATKGCGIAEPVQVSQVAGVVLSPPATINCEEAEALSSWVTNGLQPAFNNTIIALNVVDSYACRPRNNVRGNPVSVHGLGQAIDIAAFVTNTGRTYTVAQNYNAQIKAAQKAGCGTFHTILGPGSDGYHENHIHFDVSHHGGRDYCH